MSSTNIAEKQAVWRRTKPSWLLGVRRRHLRSLAMINFSLLARIFRFGRPVSARAATAPLRPPNLEGRFVP